MQAEAPEDGDPVVVPVEVVVATVELGLVGVSLPQAAATVAPTAPNTSNASRLLSVDPSISALLCRVLEGRPRHWRAGIAFRKMRPIFPIAHTRAVHWRLRCEAGVA